jgi:UDP-sugar pyrophosphorylase
LILGVPFVNGPKAILRPSFALTVAEVAEKIEGGSISDEATLLLDGKEIYLKGVILQGRSALVIKACEGARVTVTPQRIENEGFELALLSDEELQRAELPEYIRIRGYRFENRGAQIHIFDQPGDYVI